MALKDFSIALGILAGTAGVANSGYGLYKNVVVEPNQNEEQNRALATQTPLIAETVEIRPDPSMAMRVEVTIKVYPSGDILVESGARRQFIPFSLVGSQRAGASLIATALAQESAVVEGVEYDVKTVRYIETTTLLPKDRMQRVRIFEDGTVETTLIDIRANKVLQSRSEQRALSEAEHQAIERSPYKKKIFVPKR